MLYNYKTALPKYIVEEQSANKCNAYGQGKGKHTVTFMIRVKLVKTQLNEIKGFN